MKHLFSFLLILASLSVFSQFCNPKPSEVLYGSYVTNYRELRIVPHTPLREADVMWNKRVWRVLDLREKVNHPLFFPIEPTPSRTSFMQMIMNALTCDYAEIDLTAYDVLDDEFTTRLSKSEVISKCFSKEDISFENDMGEIETKTVDNPFDFSSIKRLRIKEDWFFDNQKSVMEVRIIGLCPVQEKFDEMGEYKGEMPLMWIYFPELRLPMSKTAMFNARNEAGIITYDHLFIKRKFSSYIFKESNVVDRNIYAYKQDIDLLLESKRIEEEIFTYEQDLWEY